MSHESETRELYADDPFVTPAQFGAMIEDAQARDRDEAARAEAPAPKPAEEWPAFVADEGHAAHLAAVVDGVSYMDALAAIQAARRSEEETAEQAKPCRCGAVDLWHAPGNPNCYPADDASPETVARYVLSVIEDLAATSELLAESLGLLGKLDDTRTATVAALAARVTELEARMDLRAEECRALGKRIENLTRIVAADREGLA